ncbi:MAG: ribosome recycling factor [Candidatus Komeilibacteria bacterium]|nr:ribosome recycling factor [Candidatus Komeilibacteria bacterium]
MSDFIQNYKADLTRVIEFLKSEMGSLRTNRVNSSLIENVNVEVYDALMPLIQLASISNPEARTLVIQPWDKAVVKNIEKALQQANVGAQPIVDGTLIRLSFASLTEERRKEIVKQLHQKLEEAKVSLRQIREKIKEEVINKEKRKEFSEDAKFKYLEELDELIRKQTDVIKELGESKEEEIMKI